MRSWKLAVAATILALPQSALATDGTSPATAAPKAERRLGHCLDTAAARAARRDVDRQEKIAEVAAACRHLFPDYRRSLYEVGDGHSGAALFNAFIVSLPRLIEQRLAAFSVDRDAAASRDEARAE